MKPILEFIFCLMLWALVHKCESNIKDVSCEEHWTTIKSNTRFHGGCPCIQCLLPLVNVEAFVNNTMESQKYLFEIIL